MERWLTLVPAYGRDYTEEDAVRKDWFSNRDFKIADVSSPWNGKPANRSSLSDYDKVKIRFNRHADFTVISTAEEAPHGTRRSHAKPCVPMTVGAMLGFQEDGSPTFERWKAAVNRRLVSVCGMGILDLPDQDYWSAWDAGENPAEFADEMLREEFGDDVEDLL